MDTMFEMYAEVCGPVFYVHNKQHKEYDRRNHGNVDTVQALMETFVIL